MKERIDRRRDQLEELAETLKPYKKWLKQSGYQPSTIEVTLRHLKAAVLTGNWDERHEPHLRRYLLFVKKTRRHPLGKKFTDALRTAGFEPAGVIRKQGNRTKDLLSLKSWRNLRSRLRDNKRSPSYESKLLVAYMESPYRISDFLKMRISEITEDDVSDKRAREWLAAIRYKRRGGRHMPVYKVLCDTERCAYYRLRKVLGDVCDDMGLEADLDTLYKSYHELFGEEAA